MELVNGLMEEAEKEEKAAEEAKEEDILAKVEEPKQTLLQAQEANNMLAEKLNAEKVVLTTKVEVLRGRLTNILDDEDRSLDLLIKLQKILDDCHQSVDMLHKETSDKFKDVNLIKDGVDPSVPLLSSLQKLEENKNVVAAITEAPQGILNEAEFRKSADTDNRKAGINGARSAKLEEVGPLFSKNSSLEKPKEHIINVALAMTEEGKDFGEKPELEVNLSCPIRCLACFYLYFLLGNLYLWLRSKHVL